MAVIEADSVRSIVSLSWLTGPIFDKELRVSSRRRRNYVLRSAYLLVLILFILLAWTTWIVTAKTAQGGFRAARMAEAGKSIILTVTWFQFIAAQIIAVVMLSNSISDEVRRGTLSVLMSTPITSLQIVLGKLLSRLLQLLVLIGISLSTLSVVRVFGGVQWTYVVASLCITLTAVFFVASVSLFFSITARRPYSVILILLIIIFIQYGSALISFALFGSAKPILALLVLTNPFVAMFQASSTSIWQMTVIRSSVSWQYHCIFMLAISTAVVAASVFKIRNSLLTTALSPVRTGKMSGLKKIASRFLFGRPGVRSQQHSDSMSKSPLVFKELARPFWPPTAAEIRMFVILLLLLIFAYGLWAITAKSMRYYFVSYIYTTALFMIVSVRTATMAAVSITKDREARTWATLMGTTLSNWQIVREKMLIVIARNRVGWAVMLLSPIASMIAVLSGTGISGSDAFMFLLQIPLAMMGIIADMVLLIGAGIYLSMRLKSSTSAVIATISVALGIYCFQRFVYIILIRILFSLLQMNSNIPFLMLYIIRTLFFVAIGIYLIWRTKCNLRKYIF